MDLSSGSHIVLIPEENLFDNDVRYMRGKETAAGDERVMISRISMIVANEMYLQAFHAVVYFLLH